MSESTSIEAVAASLRGAVGDLNPGDRLPSTRDLVRRLGVSPVTVSRALATLVADGAVITRPGAGTFVAERPRTATGRELDSSWQTVALGDRSIDDTGIQLHLEAVPAGTISLASGYLHPALAPTRILTAALQRAARRPDVWERAPRAGLPALRAWFATTVGGGTTADDVLITPGGQAALSVAVRSIVPAGAPLLVESPTYIGALAAARAAGVRPVPVPIDADGIRPDLLREAFRITGARALYIQPTYQNPTGAILRQDRRAAVLAAAATAGAFVIEDDYARHLVHDGRPAPARLLADDTDGRVVHIASLTKAAAPSMRVGALIARGPVAERLRAQRVVDDLFVARFVQEAALELVTGSGWARHLSALAGVLRRRREALLAALAAEAPELLHVIAPPQGGMSVWVRLPEGADDTAVASGCRQAGVLVSAGRPYFASEPPASHLRLSFTSAPHIDNLHEAVRRLALVVNATR